MCVRECVHVRGRGALQCVCEVCECGNERECVCVVECACVWSSVCVSVSVSVLTRQWVVSYAALAEVRVAV